MNFVLRFYFEFGGIAVDEVTTSNWKFARTLTIQIDRKDRSQNCTFKSVPTRTVRNG
ncbi:hypothetical protein LEP1GSC019_2872 [Leptospira interrogans serovar Pyrogenes str. 2006006960]|nr:hypothetical protein LEP1GSC019_2872 [Leptospira interrogans serovar Pyrogenes str. 2006006960]